MLESPFSAIMTMIAENTTFRGETRQSKANETQAFGKIIHCAMGSRQFFKGRRIFKANKRSMRLYSAYRARARNCSSRAMPVFSYISLALSLSLKTVKFINPSVDLAVGEHKLISHEICGHTRKAARDNVIYVYFWQTRLSDDFSR